MVYGTVDKDNQYICYQFLGLDFLLLTENWEKTLWLRQRLAEAETEITQCPSNSKLVKRGAEHATTRVFTIKDLLTFSNSDRINFCGIGTHAL